MVAVLHGLAFVAGVVSLAGCATAQTKPAGAGQFRCKWKIGQAVNTTSGTVTGHRARNATSVSEYLGIPYAKPPVAELRFQPPVEYTSTASFNGSSFGHACSQLPQNVPPGFPAPTYYILADAANILQDPREDCLSINVWTKPQTGRNLKPVLVWIYGGGFTLGSSNTTTYNGQYLADTDDVVVVNFNYRLGILGFSGSPAGEQNVAFLDQRLAVEWVHKNIAAFGGNPNKITIFGESAGGASVDYYTYAWYEKPLIAGAILESGTAFSFGNRPISQASVNWYSTATKVGCGNETTSTAEEVFTCMQKVPIQQLLDATRTTPGLTSLLGLFGPTVDNKTVFANYTDRAVTGKISQVPIVVGNNDYEPGLLIMVAAGGGQVFDISFWNALQQNLFVCPTNTAAYLRHLAGITAYRYRFMPSYPNLKLPTDYSRAYHTAEIYSIFGTSQDTSRANDTVDQIAMSRYMKNAWSTFAHCPETGLSDYLDWPVYTGFEEELTTLTVLGANGTTDAMFAKRGAYDRMDGQGACAMFAGGAFG